MNKKTKIIFLDFDGVMETVFQLSLEEAMNVETDKYGPLFDKECVQNLSKIIEATNADIVVASSWKLNLSVKELQGMWHLRHLPGRVIDSTPNINFSNDTEIYAWLQEHKNEIENYVILDDMPAECFTQEQQRHFFHVNPKTGLDGNTAGRVINFLSKVRH